MSLPYSNHPDGTSSEHAPEQSDGHAILGLLREGTKAILLAGYHRDPIPAPFTLPRRTILMAAVAAHDLTLDDAVALAIVALNEKVSAGDVKPTTARAYIGHWARFASYVSATAPVQGVQEIHQAHAVAFINAPVLTGDALSDGGNSVRSHRHGALKSLLSTLRALGVYAGDPLLDVPQPKRDPLPYRRLTDGEIDRCRFRASSAVHDTRGPCAWALAESYATTSEMPLVVIDDVDLGVKRVWLTGGARNVARWAPLTDWAAAQLDARIAVLSTDTETRGSTPLLYAGSGGASGQVVSGQASVSSVLYAILVRAGLREDRAARPLSIPAWRAHKAYAETQDLHRVQHDLGIRSLDRVAQIVGIAPPWNDNPPEHRAAER